MRLDRNEGFRELTPPAGGAARMRARLVDEGGNASHASWRFAAAGVAAMLLIGVVVAIALRNGPVADAGSPGGELYASADFDRLLGRSLTPVELSVYLGDERLELTEIPTRDPQVRFVRVGRSSAD
jgi:hypothetical protein